MSHNEPSSGNADHNQGQSDAKDDNWNPPYSAMDYVRDQFDPFVSSAEIHAQQERNDDYSDGWSNHKDQTRSSWW